MRDTLGAPAMAALECVRDELALDIGGSDFALAADGCVIVLKRRRR